MGRVIGLVAIAICAATCDAGLAPSTPASLEFTVEPNSVGLGSPIAPAVAVVVRDEAGRTVAGWTQSVAVSLEAPGGVTLAGTTTIYPVGGTAVFDDLLVGASGDGYHLMATSGGLTPAISRPFAVHEAFEAASVTSSQYHTCALTEDGTAYCWGRNYAGQLGDGTTQDRPLPTPVATELRFASLSSGAEHTCGLTADGSAYCWGMNGRGALGGPSLHTCVGSSGSSGCSMAPAPVAGALVWDRLDAGWYHTCGISSGGASYCWGEGWAGQLGGRPTHDCADGSAYSEESTEPCSPAPAPLAGTHDFVEISAGYLHTCALTADGSAWCWGQNPYGEVGDSTNTRREEPAPVYGDLRFGSISAGGGPCHNATCGLTLDGRTYCWGRNYQRFLGSSEMFLLAPEVLVDDPGFATVEVGANGVCGLQEDGALHCWGRSSYTQVGGFIRESPSPVRPDLGFVDVALGHFHVCAVTAEGPMYCWGFNTYGQLGNGSNETGWSVPVLVWRP